MLDFKPLRSKKTPLNEMVANLGVADLCQLTNEMVDKIKELIAGCDDADVVFQPVDPKANDHFAANPEDVKLAWNLGHVIVHTTASAEEAAFLGAELARGVENHGRSRSEIPWQQATTIAFCRSRLEESRRMRLATLDVWPEKPFLNTLAELWGGMAPTNAIGRFVLGLMHDDDHLDQIADIIQQSHKARQK